MEGEDRYTSGRYADANPDWHAADAPHKADALAELVGAAGLRPRSVLEVGCGTGEVLRALRERLEGEGPGDTTWEGWDVAGEAIARARPQAGMRFVHGDLLQSDARADLVLCVDVFEHVADDLAFLRALRRHGERFLFRIPLDLSVLDLLRPHRLIEARRRYGHRHAYTRALARATLEEAGYTLLAERYHRVPVHPDRAVSRVSDGIRRAAVRIAPHAAVASLGGYSLVVLAR